MLPRDGLNKRDPSDRKEGIAGLSQVTAFPVSSGASPMAGADSVSGTSRPYRKARTTRGRCILKRSD